MDMNGPAPPKVSVIIPTYNQADLLAKALQSVVMQTYSDWEAIVIDNHSPDGTKDVVESIRDTRIRYLPFSNRGVIAASRNHGIRMAAGDIIAFLDSDDLWYPTKIAECLIPLEQGADIVCHGLRIRRDGTLGEIMSPGPIPGSVFASLLFRGNSAIATSAVMAKKVCFDRFGLFSEDPALVTAEDYEMWLRLAGSGVRWAFIPVVLGEYTVHGMNASGNVQKQMLAEERIVMKYCREMPNPTLRERLACRKRRMMVILRAGARIWQTGNIGAALPYFLKGILRGLY